MRRGSRGLRRRLIFTATALAIAAAGRAASVPVVATDSGRLQGVMAGDGVAAYLGIPYAAAPVGALRWRPPQPAPSWRGIRQASAFGADCLQWPMDKPPGPGFVNQSSEDCLFLNVWAPLGPPHARRPVMVWIYGGAWIMGAGSWPTYHGGAFAADGVVLVTFNYRLGRFGFFAHPALTREAPQGELANYGLMDQLAALAWVRRNIARFGGDPDNVTVFGESAGGRSVNLLMAMPQARGLFQKAISESGGGQDRLATLADAQAQGAAWARSHGIAEDADAAALRALPARDVLDLEHFFKWPLPAPVVDGHTVPRQVDEAFQSGQVARVPYLAGSNSYEQSLLRWLPPDTLERKLRALGPYRDRLLDRYREGGKVEASAAAPVLYGEATRAAPARFYAARMADLGEPAWLYRYGYVPQAVRGKVPGAAHGAEVGLVFHNERAPSSFGEDARDAPMAAAIHGYWVRFAATGNPNGPGQPAWPPYTRRSDRMLQFTDDGIQATRSLHADRLDLFDQAFLWYQSQPGS